MTNEERQAWEAKLRKIDAEIANLNAMTAKAAAEIPKFQAETAKLITENRWYVPVVSAGIASGATLAVVAVTKLFL